MQDSEDRESAISFRTLAAVAVAFVLAVAILTSEPRNTERVAVNPGASGIPGSTTPNQSAPPAAGPSETTTGAAR